MCVQTGPVVKIWIVTDRITGYRAYFSREDWANAFAERWKKICKTHPIDVAEDQLDWHMRCH